MKNKVLGILICLSMVVCLFPVRVSAATPATIVELGDVDTLVAAADDSVTPKQIQDADAIVVTVGVAEIEAAVKSALDNSVAYADLTAADVTIDSNFESSFKSLMNMIRTENPTAIVVVGAIENPAANNAGVSAAVNAVNSVITANANTYLYSVAEAKAPTISETDGQITINDATYDAAIAAEYEKVAAVSVDKTTLDFGSYYENAVPAAKTIVVTNNSSVYTTAIELPEVEGLVFSTKAAANAYGSYTLAPGAKLEISVSAPAKTVATSFVINAIGGEVTEEVTVNAGVKDVTTITLLPGYEGGKKLTFAIGVGQTMEEVLKNNAEFAAAAKEYARAGYELRGFYAFTETDGEITLGRRILKPSFTFDLANSISHVINGTWQDSREKLELVASWRVANYDIEIGYEDKEGKVTYIEVDGNNMNDILGELGDGISYNPTTNVLTISGDHSNVRVYVNGLDDVTDLEKLTVNGVNGKVDRLYAYAGKVTITGSLNSERVSAEEIVVDKTASLTTEKVSAATVEVAGSLTGNADDDTAVEVDALKVSGNVTINADNQIGIAARILKITATGSVKIDNASKGALLVGSMYDKDTRPELEIEKGGKYTTTNTDTAVLTSVYTPDKEVILDPESVIKLPEGYLAADEEIVMISEKEKYEEGYKLYYTLAKVGSNVKVDYYENTPVVRGDLGNVALPQGSVATTTPDTPTVPGTSTGTNSGTVNNPNTSDAVMSWAGLLALSLTALGLSVRSFVKQD